MKVKSLEEHMAPSTLLSNKTKKTRRIIIILSIILLVFLSLFLFLRFSPYKDLKTFINTRPYSTRVYDKHNELIQILPLEDGLRREYLPLSKIPPKVVDAFIFSEDKNFYKHFGIDISAIFRALFQNASNDEIISGASTITMQLARIISPHPKRNIFGKIKEAINALRIELRLTKNEILELYLNNIPFGFNTEGVASAARTFYGKSIFRLNDNEIYTLSVIPRRPSGYNPLTNPTNCAEITSKVFNLNKDTLIKTTENAKQFNYPLNMPHYINYLKDKNIGFYGKSDITLSCDLNLQHRSEDLLKKYLFDFSKNRISNGAILVINTKTGEILTWVGSGDFNNKESKGQIDGVLATNQPGSSMKPFLYALALDYGYSPSSILPDIPTDFGFEELYVPQNFNNRFNGPVRLRTALASSLNVPAVYLLNEIGINTYTDKLKEAGFYSLENSNPGLGIALGNAEVSLFELVQAYSVFPRDGYFIPLRSTPLPRPIDLKNEKQIYSTDSSRLICDILSDKSARATGFRSTKAFSTSFPSMFKTGTANQYQNITALAATPLYTVGVWMGNFDGETVVGKTGSSIPASIAKTILETIQTENIPFNKPVQLAQTEICSLSGMIPTQNCPHVITEYVKSSENQKCTWHTDKGVVYPAIYNNWLNQKNREGIIDSFSPLTIMSPKNNSIFYFDNNASNKQKLFIEITAPQDETIYVSLLNKDTNNTLDFEIINNFRFTVPLEKGNFRLKLTCNEESEEINYTVY